MPSMSKSSIFPRPRIGVIRDGAFQFYYPENLEALETAGAEVVTISALEDTTLPELNGLYIGGGFPETHAKELANNKGFREDVRRIANQGLPIYAECGGLMYLGESLILDGVTYPMVGVLPVFSGSQKGPRGTGTRCYRWKGPIRFSILARRSGGMSFIIPRSWIGMGELIIWLFA